MADIRSFPINHLEPPRSGLEHMVNLTKIERPLFGVNSQYHPSKPLLIGPGYGYIYRLLIRSTLLSGKIKPCRRFSVLNSKFVGSGVLIWGGSMSIPTTRDWGYSVATSHAQSPDPVPMSTVESIPLFIPSGTYGFFLGFRKWGRGRSCRKRGATNVGSLEDGDALRRCWEGDKAHRELLEL